MKWWGWVLLGAAIGLGLALLWRGDPSEEVQRLRDRIAADSLRSVQTDSLLAARDSAAARVSRETDSLRRVLAGQAGQTQELSEAHAAAREAARTARLALDSARTLADTLNGLYGALGAETRRAEAAEAVVGSLRAEVAHSARLVALADSVTRVREEQLAAVRADRDRLRKDLTDAMTTIGKLERRRTGFLPHLGQAVETGAVAAATVGACRQGLLTIGCVAGAGVTLSRLL